VFKLRINGEKTLFYKEKECIFERPILCPAGIFIETAKLETDGRSFEHES